MPRFLSRVRLPSRRALVIGTLAVGIPVAVIGPLFRVGTPPQEALTPDGWNVRGDPAAPVVITEYADFQCPACAEHHRYVEGELDTSYVRTKRARFVHVDYPLPFHKNAVLAAEAARCAGEQQKFWVMAYWLYGYQISWVDRGAKDAERMLVEMSGNMYMDRAKFRACLKSDRHLAQIRRGLAQGDEIGVSGTPTFAVNGVAVDTSAAETYDDVLALLDEAVLDAEDAIADQATR